MVGSNLGGRRKDGEYNHIERQQSSITSLGSAHHPIPSFAPLHAKSSDTSHPFKVSLHSQGTMQQWETITTWDNTLTVLIVTADLVVLK